MAKRRSSSAPPRGARLMNAQQAAAYTGLPYTTLRDAALGVHGRLDRDAREPVLPCVRIPGCRRLWFDVRDLDRAIERWKQEAITRWKETAPRPLKASGGAKEVRRCYSKNQNTRENPVSSGHGPSV